MFSNLTFFKAVTRSLKATVTKAAFVITLLTFSFTADAQTISIGSATGAVEGSSNITFVIAIDGGGVNSTGSAITGTISYSGTATVGSDFVGPATFSIPDLANSTTITVVVVDDLIIEATETVNAVISGLNIGTVGNANSTAFIFDDDSGALFISIGSPVSGTEGAAGAIISFDVFIEGGGVNGSGSPITGSISYTGTANPGVDYSAATSYSIPVGANSTTVILPIFDDPNSEPTETVVANLTGNPTIGAYANTSSTANIFDDDSGALGISIAALSDGTEGGSNGLFVVSMDNGVFNNTGADIYGSISYSGTATSSDFSGPALFSIPNGEATDTISIIVIDDFEVEYTETIIATISNPNVGVIGNAYSTVNIFDNELSSLALSIYSPVDGTEGSSDVSFTIVIDNGFTNGTGVPITGSLSYTGTATAGTDFSSVTSFAIPNGASFVVLTIPVVDDLIAEPTESVIVTIGSPSEGVISPSNTETAYIVDNDSTNSINEIQFSDLTINVYPNPVSSTLTIEAEQQMLGVEMSDLQGRTIQTWKVSSKKVDVNIDGMPEGYYIFTVLLDDGTVASKKVLKE